MPHTGDASRLLYKTIAGAAVHENPRINLPTSAYLDVHRSVLENRKTNVHARIEDARDDPKDTKNMKALEGRRRIPGWQEIPIK